MAWRGKGKAPRGRRGRGKGARGGGGGGGGATPVLYECPLCNVRLRSAGDLELHCAGQRHAESVRRAGNSATAPPAPTTPSTPAAPAHQGAAGSGPALSAAPLPMALEEPPTRTRVHARVEVMRHVDEERAGMLEVMAGDPSLRGAVDLVLMDLPYFLRLGAWDDLCFVCPHAPAEAAFYSDLAVALHRTVTPTGFVVLFYNDRHMVELAGALRRAGFKYVDHVVWLKDRSYSAPRVGFHNVVERALVASRAECPCIHYPVQTAAQPPSATGTGPASDTATSSDPSADAPPDNVWRFDSVPPAAKLRVDGEIEKCEKPPALLRHIMQLFLPPRETAAKSGGGSGGGGGGGGGAGLPLVADFCAGSASLVTAALDEPCRCLVFDKRQAFCAEAARLRVERHSGLEADPGVGVSGDGS